MVEKGGFGHLGRAGDPVTAEIGDVSVVECFVAEFNGMPVNQHNMYAEFVVKGYWVDFHLSKVMYKPADHKLFEQIVKGVDFLPKKEGE